MSDLALGLEARPRPSWPGPSRALLEQAWAGTWPKLIAVVLVIGVWQAVVWSGWRPDYALPGPWPVFQRLGADLGRPDFWVGVLVTMRRALTGYLIAVVLGGVTGILIARVRILRKATVSSRFG